MTRRDVSPAEMELFATLCATAPDLTSRSDALLAAAAGAPSGAPAGSASGMIRPKTVRELIELINLRVITPAEARQVVDIPAITYRPIWPVRLWRNLTSAARYAKLAAFGPAAGR